MTQNTISIIDLPNSRFTLLPMSHDLLPRVPKQCKCFKLLLISFHFQFIFIIQSVEGLLTICRFVFILQDIFWVILGSWFGIHFLLIIVKYHVSSNSGSNCSSQGKEILSDWHLANNWCSNIIMTSNIFIYFNFTILLQCFSNKLFLMHLELSSICQS